MPNLGYGDDAKVNMSISRSASLCFSFEGEGKSLEELVREVTFFCRVLQFAMLPRAGTHLLHLTAKDKEGNSYRIIILRRDVVRDNGRLNPAPHLFGLSAASNICRTHVKKLATFFEEYKDKDNAWALLDLLTRPVYWRSQLLSEMIMNACYLVECAYRFLKKESGLQQGLEFFLGREEVKEDISFVLYLLDKEFPGGPPDLIKMVVNIRNEIAHGDHRSTKDDVLYRIVPVIYYCLTHALLWEQFKLSGAHLKCEYPWQAFGDIIIVVVKEEDLEAEKEKCCKQYGDTAKQTWRVVRKGATYRAAKDFTGKVPIRHNLTLLRSQDTPGCHYAVCVFRH